jgi:Rrf2 family protein
VEIVTWPAFPKRLQSALKALCCLAQSGGEMQSQEIARQIEVSSAETAKILQLLVWGSFVTSKRGSKGGFQLASKPEGIKMGAVIDFFLAGQRAEPEGNSPVMKVLHESIAPCQKAFGKLSLADVTGRSRSKARKARSMRAPRTHPSRQRKTAL